jgi:hypothetical protein
MQLAAVGGPAALVGLAHLLMTPAPATPPSNGLAASTPTLMPVGGRKTGTAEQARAAQWVRSLGTGALASPLDHRAPPPVAEPPKAQPEVKPPAPPPTPAENPLAGLSLTATLRQKDGSGLAAISGKIYRVGDQVGRGCKLVGIDTSENKVELQLPDGTKAQLSRSR